MVHPGLITPDDVDILDGTRRRTSLREVYGYEPGWGSLGPELRGRGRGAHATAGQ